MEGPGAEPTEESGWGLEGMLSYLLGIQVQPQGNSMPEGYCLLAAAAGPGTTGFLCC